jgi:hypothetical protein
LSQCSAATFLWVVQALKFTVVCLEYRIFLWGLKKKNRDWGCGSRGLSSVLGTTINQPIDRKAKWTGSWRVAGIACLQDTDVHVVCRV